MNSKQRVVLWSWLILFLAMLVVPPWHLTDKGADSYHLFFPRPCKAVLGMFGETYQARLFLDVNTLIMQICLLSLFTAVLYAVLANKRTN